MREFVKGKPTMPLEAAKLILTGVEWQDQQHLTLLQKLEGLELAMRDNSGQSEIGNLFTFLFGYAEEHFQCEQKAMSECGYPDTDSHTALHAEFVIKLKEIHDHYTRQGASTYIVMRSRQLLRDWLMMHIQGPDRELAAYIHYAEKQKVKA
jgi:hemerythrin